MSGGRERIAPDFFTASPVACARRLVGCELFWDGCAGRIVETEAYAEQGDEACHTAFRPAAREFVDRHPAGTAYVYLNYGVHWLFNILVRGEAGAGFVLLRALEPTAGVEKMRKRRGKSGLAELCSGPGKLTQALGIRGSAHGRVFLTHPTRGLRMGAAAALLEGPRVGISKETGLFWRFGTPQSPCLSRPF